MVRADGLNLDCLELIFGYLSGSDLACVAAVCRSFFAGVVPRLYSTLSFALPNAKRYRAVISPFAAVALHPEYAVHVRHIDIRDVPIVKSHFNPRFLQECIHALSLCPNVVSFRCSSAALPPFLGPLAEKERLHDLRIHASLTTEQSLKLVHLVNVRNLTLDFASWNILNQLPEWSRTLSANLTTLTLYSANELNETVLEQVLEQLPSLLGLHIVNCSKVDHVTVLGLLTHTPLLEALSLTTGDGSRILPTPPPALPYLKHLALDVRLSASQPSVSVVSNILTYLSAPIPTVPPSANGFVYPAPSLTAPIRASSAGAHLESFVIRYPDRQTNIPVSLTTLLVNLHGSTLRSASFKGCVVGVHDALPPLCKDGRVLERLALALPVRDMAMFTLAIEQSSTIRALIDLETHATSSHTPRPSLAADSVRHLFAKVPSLRTVVSEGTRIWSRGRDGQATLERATTSGAGSGGRDAAGYGRKGLHWFMPREI
ncbi:hypothetical protein MKEN_00297600 [Mycena kentingensis (nom. inval.)]|nr:hypothetical protein MKEN_00297600 [Mycena kentingensis (nom. inval.)]